MKKQLHEELYSTVTQFLMFVRKSTIRPLIEESAPFQHQSTLQTNVLLMLSFWGPLSMSEIAANMALSKQQMTQIVKKLSESGYVTRTFDRQDGRKIIIELSEQGIEAAEFIKQKAIVSINNIVDNMPEEKLAEIISTIKYINDFMENN